MNTLEFHGSKVDEDRQVFIEEINKIMDIMDVTLVEKEHFAGHQLKWVSQAWYDQWKEERAMYVGPFDWDKFKWAFVDRLFSIQIRGAKVKEFLNLRQETWVWKSTHISPLNCPSML